MLSEDVEVPRGLACITYNNECARELENRLQLLGIEPDARVFIGTVHSFSLTQIILPYAKTAQLGLPDDFSVANQKQQRDALEDALRRIIGQENPARWKDSMGKYRRSILDRNSAEWRSNDPQLAALVEAYENELRKRGLIDFDDMPLLAVRALKENEWLQQALLAKYPILAVDEYQDLGRALHRMVMGLCFSTGIRLFAVGDVDQSIYGFTGARPELLQSLSKREGVQTVHLRLNYRCGSQIVKASSYALGEDRNYEAPKGAHRGTIYFHPCKGMYSQHARYLFATILPAALARMPEIGPGDVAVLYPTAAIGDDVAAAAEANGYQVVRADTNALYPRGSRIIRWLEECAAWCCEGWRTGSPRFYKLTREGSRLLTEALDSDAERALFQGNLMEILWSQRDPQIRLNTWLLRIYNELLVDLLKHCKSVSDEMEMLGNFMKRTSPGEVAEKMTIGEFCGRGEAGDRINLSTLHSSKGREFALVVMFAMDQGRIPWNNVGEHQIRESRRLFYVGFTRAKTELHLMYTDGNPSPFVNEVMGRIRADEAAC